MKKKLTINFKEKRQDYDIIIGNNIINEYILNDSVFIIDSNVFKYHRDALPAKCVNLFEASESNKSWKTVLAIIDFLLQQNCNRQSKIYAIGGGITGDVVAYTASIYMRGIPLMQVPTTLLSMVDSSVGGKTGINYGEIKNLIGTFYQPKQVVIDINFLKSLQNDEYINGLAEVVKMAFMFDCDLVSRLKYKNDALLSRDYESLFEIINRSIELKAHIVEIDEKEENERKLLNFGHTIGHAVEVDSDFSIKHGYAVAIGMFYECLYGVKNNLIDPEVLDALIEVLKLYNLLNKYKIKNLKKFKYALSKDKKIGSEGVVFSLPTKLGESEIFKNIDLDNVIKVISDN
jgi:3-dehydroquinate synthase